MDLSALIFVALAVAWAVYLVPKALRHHDDVARSRTVDRFSRSMRVLARREPVDRRSARLVRPGRPAAEAPTAAPDPARDRAPDLAPAQLSARRAAVARATKRRRNVLGLLLVVTLAVAGVAVFGMIEWWYVAIPVGVLVTWLVACRVMVKGERRALAPARRDTAGRSADRMPGEAPVPSEAGEAANDVPDAAEAGDGEAAGLDDADPMADTSAGISAVVDPELWDPVPVTLPTYVSKPAARRTVRTIDLEATGVWTSGRTDADAQLARDAEQAEKAEKAEKAVRQSRGDDGRAVGS